MVAWTETRLATTERKDVSDGDMQVATPLNLILLTYKWVKFSFGSLYITAFYPKIQNPVYQLLKEVVRQVIVTSDNETMITDEKQLRPCPTRERAANVDKVVLTNSFKNSWKFFRSRALRLTLFTFFSAADNSLASRKCASAMGAKHDWLLSTYASHFSIRGWLELNLFFCGKQYTNLESCTNAR